MMLATWCFAVLLFFALPFQLVGRTVTTYGFEILALLLLTFCGAALIASPPWRGSHPALPGTAVQLQMWPTDPHVVRRVS